MATIFDLLKTHYPEWTFKLKRFFPEMLEFSKQVPVFSWKEEYNVADYKPELILEIEKLEKRLENGEITQEEYEKKVKDLGLTYASITKGIAFNEEGFVAFRDEIPSLGILLHELGHVYFQVPDAEWGASYGGGEILFWLALDERYKITEENIRHYMELLRRARIEPQRVGEELAEKIAKAVSFDCLASLYVFSLYAGVIPDEVSQYALEDLPFNPVLLEIPYTEKAVVDFLVHTVDGLRWDDSFCIAYARAMGLIE